MIDCCVDDEIHILSHEIFQYLLLCFVMNYVFVHNYCVILLLILYTQCMSCYIILYYRDDRRERRDRSRDRDGY